MPWTTVVPLAVAAGALGALFAAVEVATVAFAEEEGSRQVAGLLLGAWALGSLVAGVGYGLVTWRTTTLARLRRFLPVLALTMAPLWALDGFLAMGAVLLVAGVAISPTLITAMALVSEHVPPGRRTEGMSIVHTGLASAWRRAPSSRGTWPTSAGPAGLPHAARGRGARRGGRVVRAGADVGLSS